MNVIITESQLKLLCEVDLTYEPCGRGGNMQIHPEDIIFFIKFYEKYGFLPYPKEMERLGSIVKIGDIYPDHPMSHLTTKSYYICKSKVFKNIRDNVSKQLGLILSDTKRGSKRYITNDGKYELRSIYEVIFYNIFMLNGESENLEVDSKKFYNQCGEIQKEVDFIYKGKTAIEIAGMSKPEYFDKIISAMKCIESLGYNAIVYKTRELTRASSYYDFYKEVCKDFNFPIDESINSNIELLIGHNNLDKETMKKFIDDNIGSVTQNTDPKRYYQLKMYIKKLYGMSVSQYRKEQGIKQKNR
jgi:hypothetical protein